MLTKLLLFFSVYLPITPQISETTLCKETTTSSWGFSVDISSSDLHPVYKQDGSLQCDLDSHSNASIKHMKKELKNSGVKVYRSVAGHLKTRSPAVCGSPTSRVNIFYVRQSDLALTVQNGFRMCSGKTPVALLKKTSSHKEKKEEAIALSIASLALPEKDIYSHNSSTPNTKQRKLTSTISEKNLPSYSPPKPTALIVSLQDLDIL